MTFSIAARDETTGHFGLAITTSSLCVGARCVFARAGAGAVLTQHRTDPRLGSLGLDLLTQGYDADQTIEILTDGRDDAKWRQVAVVDRNGACAAFHGSEIYSLHGHATDRGAIALGNILRSEDVPAAMLDGYLSATDLDFKGRLLKALFAGLDAGGELKPVRSAALLITGLDPFPLMDVRIDRDDTPVHALANLAKAYEPAAEGFRARVLQPDTVPNDPELLSLHAGLSVGVRATGTEAAGD